MKNSKEDKFRKRVFLFFKKKLKKSSFYSRVAVVEKKQILKDVTMVNDKTRFHNVKKTRWSLILGFQEQDIIFVSRTFIEKKRFANSDIIEFSRCPDWVLVPLIICELKIGSNLTTHNLLTCSQIAREIKYLQPFCKYFIIVDKGRTFFGETIARQTKEIDGLFLNWEEDKNFIWRGIKNYLHDIKSLKYI